jgi:hypothetical protein
VPTKTKHYVPIPDSGDHLKIEPRYDKGGSHAFSGSANRRGLYVHFTRITREKTASGFVAERFTIFGNSNYKVMALELSRANSRKEEALAAYVEKHLTELSDAWLADDRDRVAQIVTAFAP